jgi:hypothetical protein
MFNSLNSDSNKKDNFTCELSKRGIDGSLGAVGQGNGGGVQYGVQYL